MDKFFTTVFNFNEFIFVYVVNIRFTCVGEIYLLIVEIIDFWKGLPNSKKTGKGKIGANTIYNHVCLIQKGPLVPRKLQFFEDIAKTLNSFLVPYQTDKPMILFLAESLETFLRSLCMKFIRKDVLESAKTASLLILCMKFIRKDVLESAKTASLLIKRNLADKANRNYVNSVHLGFGLKYELKSLIDSKKVTNMQNFQFKKEALVFSDSLCSHAGGKKVHPDLCFQSV